MADRPKADFSEACAPSPREYDGMFMQNAACAAPVSQTYREAIAKTSEGFLGVVQALQAERSEAFVEPAMVQLVGALKQLPLPLRAQTVNHIVNDSIAYETDMQNHGKEDYWQTPLETLKRGKGDCEDIALLKMGLLERSGVPKEQMWIATGLLADTTRKLNQVEAHATLVLEYDGKPHVLDNFYRKGAPIESALPTLDEFARHTKFVTAALMNEGKVLSRIEPELDKAYNQFRFQQQLNGIEEGGTTVPTPKRPQGGLTPG